MQQLKKVKKARQPELPTNNLQFEKPKLKYYEIIAVQQLPLWQLK